MLSALELIFSEPVGDENTEGVADGQDAETGRVGRQYPANGYHEQGGVNPYAENVDDGRELLERETDTWAMGCTVSN